MAEVLLQKQEAEHQQFAESVTQPSQQEEEAGVESPPEDLEKRLEDHLDPASAADDATRILPRKAQQTELPQA